MATSVAVIVVHGVADQKQGETADAFVDLMVAAMPNGARYSAVGSEDFVVPVAPMAPELPYAFDPAPPAAGVAPEPGATPYGRDRGFAKSWRQSIRSDFADDAADRGRSDRGLAFTRYLLHKARRNGAATEHYASRKTALRRSTPAGGETAIDVYEMYWADLSRLSSALPRIVTELFTTLFRLSRLGRDTVDEARRHAAALGRGGQRAWTWLARLQTLIDWSFTNVLAQLFAQLLLTGLLAIAIGAVAPRDEAALSLRSASTAAACLKASNAQRLCDREAEAVAAPAAAKAVVDGRVAGVGWALLAIALLAVVHFSIGRRNGRARRMAVAAAAVGACLIVSPTWGYGLAWAALLSVVYLRVLRSADDRFPFVYQCGRAMWFALLAFSAAHVLQAVGIEGKDALAGDPWGVLLRGAVTAFEYVLLAIKWWWIAMALVFVAWALLSAGLTFTARRRANYRVRGSAATGRLGVVLSLASFLVVTMALWAALGTSLKLALTGQPYVPAVWADEATSTPRSAKPLPADASWLMQCDPLVSSGPRDAAQFVDCRFVGSTASFALVVAIMLVVVVYMLVTITPSLLAELRWTSSDERDEARRLGWWLTWFYRHLDRVILGLMLFGVLLIVIVAFVFFLPLFSLPVAVARGDMLADPSQALLHWFVLPAATTLAALIGFGGVISRLAPGIRAPLDAALDVDNYLREFPRRSIPRARIFARYAALLQRIAAGGYGRVVVVSHSQGTVISAELLRYVASTSVARRQQGRNARLKALLGCDSVHLLTLGCPLRQLYAARFPVLYDWVLDVRKRPNGPCADDVGVDVWANAFGSGDYVGRWLWSQPLVPRRSMHPMSDRAGHDVPAGREFAYDAFVPMPPPPKDLAGLREYETCVGYAAHTHYFDPPDRPSGQSVVALLADALIAG